MNSLLAYQIVAEMFKRDTGTQAPRTGELVPDPAREARFRDWTDANRKHVDAVYSFVTG